MNDSDDLPDPASEEVMGEITPLYRDCPLWAVWLPSGGHWTAVRPASDRLPSPGLPLLWAHGMTAREIRNQMRAIDAELARQRG